MFSSSTSSLGFSSTRFGGTGTINPFSDNFDNPSNLSPSLSRLSLKGLTVPVFPNPVEENPKLDVLEESIEEQELEE
jgi:hypothetical protein